MITSAFLNLIYLFFPLGCYFIYLVYSKVTYEKERDLFFLLAVLSSFYLCVRFGDRTSVSFFAINILLILSLYKKNLISSIVLLISLSYLFAGIYNISIWVLLIQYFLILLVIYLKKKDIVNTFIIFYILFDIIIMIFKHKSFTINIYAYVVLSWAIIYAVLILLMNLYKKLEIIINMYHSLEEVTKEKTLYQSLFKITHEIKNPLAVCKGYLDMFDIKNPSKANKYVSIINQEIDRTLLLLKDFSDVSKLKVEKSMMDVNMLLEDVCDEAMIILKSNVKFEYELCDKETYIYGDYNRLKQVLINVIKNAKEALGERGKVILTSKCKHGEYEIDVKDNGVGMNKEVKEKIGTPFYTTKKNGTGLGVCFSKEIVEMHGGKMMYYSKEGKGTKVRITLPIKKYTG